MLADLAFPSWWFVPPALATAIAYAFALTAQGLLLWWSRHEPALRPKRYLTCAAVVFTTIYGTGSVLRACHVIDRAEYLRGTAPLTVPVVVLVFGAPSLEAAVRLKRTREALSEQRSVATALRAELEAATAELRQHGPAR